MHTPGPWTASDWSGNHDTPIEIIRDDRDSEDVGPMICEVNTDLVSIEQAFADARLIAAAPDLLAAAIKALDTLETVAALVGGATAGTDADTHAARLALTAAIAKAAGGAA